MYSDKDNVNIEDFLKRLSKVNLGESICSAIKNLNIKEDYSEDSYSGGYDYLLDSHRAKVSAEELLKGTILDKGDNSINESEASDKNYPEVGDIALLKVKLRNDKTLNPKKTYLGYERRPVLIINVKNESVIDGLELTHCPKFKNYNLIQIDKFYLDGVLGDINNSYVNIFVYKDYVDLECDYFFPEFNSDGTPKTKYQLQLETFGKIYECKDENKPFLFKYSYKDNYVKTLSKEEIDRVIMSLKKYQEEENISKK